MTQVTNMSHEGYEGYQYDERLRAPNVVEFGARTNLGYRIVTIYLDNPDNPRIIAFHETASERSPATLFLSEVHQLITRARELASLKSSTKDLFP